MKRSTVLIVLAAVVVLVVMAIAALTYLPSILVPGATQGKEPEQEPAAEIVLSPIKQSDIAKMELVSKNGTLRMELRDGTWKLVSTVIFNVREDTLADLTFSFANLTAMKIVDERPGNLGQYGLANPAVIARVSPTGGSALEFRLGNMTSAGNSYYLMVAGDPRVYAVSDLHARHFLYTINDLWATSREPINVQAVTYLKIVRRGETLVELSQDPNASMVADAEFLMTSTFVRKPWAKPKPVNWDYVATFLNKVDELSKKEIVDVDPTDLDMYGLDSPSYELSLRDTKNRLHMIFGRVEGEQVFLKYANETPVYAGDRKLLSLLAVKPFDFVNKLAAIVELSRVDTITMRGPGRNHTVRVEHTKGQDGVEETFTVDGRPVEAQPFRQFYQKIIGLIVDSVYEETIAEKPDFSITYSLNSGNVREYRVAFVPYNADFYALFKNGESDTLVNRAQVKNLLEEIDDYMEKVSGSPAHQRIP